MWDGEFTDHPFRKSEIWVQEGHGGVYSPAFGLAVSGMGLLWQRAKAQLKPSISVVQQLCIVNSPQRCYPQGRGSKDQLLGGQGQCHFLSPKVLLAFALTSGFSELCL